ncbi:hypothetical protein C4D60_Mb02t11390 [Musa balbisiana]|uniref:Uncharacterized protein n=1 Tax=Musa balbisiana TaxID=52838 RepID=A0A4S8IA44_MUSBA|nr:hypothetical protein C4D60_Mb02t11390 [Musa balbisiana]
MTNWSVLFRKVDEVFQPFKARNPVADTEAWSRAPRRSNQQKKSLHDAATGTGNLDHPLHPRSCTMQTTGASGFEDSRLS